MVRESECISKQEWAELRLPIDSAELQAAGSQARGGLGLTGAEVLLEMRAQLSTAMPWAPMVTTYTSPRPVLSGRFMMAEEHLPHRAADACVAALQGHVVAEQQLPVPNSWIREDDDAMPDQAPPPLAKPLHFSQEERSGSKVITVTGANDLYVEVLPRPSFNTALYKDALWGAFKPPQATVCTG